MRHECPGAAERAQHLRRVTALGVDLLHDRGEIARRDRADRLDDVETGDDVLLPDRGACLEHCATCKHTLRERPPRRPPRDHAMATSRLTGRVKLLATGDQTFAWAISASSSARGRSASRLILARTSVKPTGFSDRSPVPQTPVMLRSPSSSISSL